MVPALGFQAAGSIAELSHPLVLQQQVLLSLAGVPLWGAHRHCLPLSNLHLSQFLQAAELCSCPLQQEEDLYELDRDICAVGKLFHTLSWSCMGSSKRMCSTAHSMAARF